MVFKKQEKPSKLWYTATAFRTLSVNLGIGRSCRFPRTVGLMGTPNELKLKYLADNQFGDLEGEDLHTAIRRYIRTKTRILRVPWNRRAPRPAG